MSFSGLFAIGVSGVTAFAKGLEAVSNNIANSQTVGYKRLRTDFSELVTKSSPESGGRAGAGVEAQRRQLLFEQGGVARTGADTNIAVSGGGFFVVSETPNGGGVAPFVFTRAGDFAPDLAGNLQNRAGFFLQGYALGAEGEPVSGVGLGALEAVNINRAPPLPAGAADPGALAGVEITAEGDVVASYANGESYALFRVPLALFTNVEGLEDGAATSFLSATSAGRVRLLAPGEGAAGLLEGSAVEVSTVDIGQEFSTLIETQRAYATNARLISVADELWSRLVETAA